MSNLNEIGKLALAAGVGAAGAYFLTKSKATSAVKKNSVSEGAKFPAVQVDFGFPPEKVNMAERLKDKKVLVVGMPGAFTPT